MEKTLNLKISETCAHTECDDVIWAQEARWEEDRLRRRLCRNKKKEKKKSTLLRKTMSPHKSPSWSSKEWKEHAGWKPGPVMMGNSQSSQEQDTKESQKESRWMKVFREAGLLRHRGTEAAKRPRQGTRICRRKKAEFRIKTKWIK